MISDYERPDEFDEWSTRERLNHIVGRLRFISRKEQWKDMRSRSASEEQLQEEFGSESGYDELLKQIWFSAKEDYYKHKDQYEAFVEENSISDENRQYLEAMNRVVDEEVEQMLLDTED